MGFRNTSAGRDRGALCFAIASAVAEREGVDVRSLSDPLYHAVDPEALAALLRGESARVAFDYHGYRVTVDHEHDVDVVPLEER